MIDTSTWTDEQWLKEFVKRFKCDGACLIYFDKKDNFVGWFTRWRNPIGSRWCSTINKALQQFHKQPSE